MNPAVSNQNKINPVGRIVLLAPNPTGRRRIEWPPFSSFPLLFLVMIKPLTDAFYEVEAVKYGYILLLLSASLFAKYGQVIQGATADPRNKQFLAYILLIILYFYFQFGLAITYGGNFAEMFKIVSPFVFFVLVAYAADRWLLYALGAGAVLTILINAAFLPFDFGWVNWGGTRTFKGYYFFKTDLSYSLCFSVLLCAFYMRNKITPVLAGLILIAAVEVLLANSRLNYLSFILVVIFIMLKGGTSIGSLAKYSFLLGLLGLVIALLYDPTKLLGFDTTNEAAFTQGRSVTWQHLATSMLDFSPIDWLFGKGAFADLMLSQDINGAGQVAHNAHNEILHLIYTQGVFGVIFYFLLWFMMFKMSHIPNIPKWARGTDTLALSIFVLQGMTAVLSSFATKTWPLVMVLLALRGLGIDSGKNTQSASPS